MNQILRFLGLSLLAGLSVVSFISCISGDNVAREMGNLIADVRGDTSGSGESDDQMTSKSEEPAQATSGKSDSDDSEEENSVFGRLLMDATGMTAMQDYMVAMMVYANAFYAGGFVYGYDDFEEGQGVVWRVTSRDYDDETVVRVERALLKKEATGSWWLLSYESEDESFVSEAFIGADYELLIFRYEDPDRREIREWRAEMTEGEDTREKDEVEATMDEAQPGFFAGDYQSYVVGTETIRVPAGSFTADHIRIDEEYDGGGISYEWWISEDVPGRLVKYDWKDSSADAEVIGELIEIRDDYRTRLNSY